MKQFFIKWLVNIIALSAVSHVIAGVSIDSWPSVIVAALALGLLNAFLRPVIILFTLPLELLSLGFFTLVINGFMFYLASKFVPGFAVAGFWSAFWAAILFSIISFILSLLFIPNATFKFGAGGYGHENDPKRYQDAIDVDCRVADTDAAIQKKDKEKP